MNALDVYTKINIKDYLARPEAKFDKEYSEERQKIRIYIRQNLFNDKQIKIREIKLDENLKFFHNKQKIYNF